MKIGEIVEHKNKVSESGYPHDGKYFYWDECRVKDRQTGEWFDAVLYLETGSEGKLFVREKKDFMNKFQKVNDASKD